MKLTLDASVNSLAHVPRFNYFCRHGVYAMNSESEGIHSLEESLSAIGTVPENIALCCK
jgi:hypothetical protein